MKKRSTVAAFLLALAAFAADSVPAIQGRLTARKDHDISPVWVPKKFMGRDFRLSLPVSRYRPPEDPAERAEFDAKKLNKYVYLPYPQDKLPPDVRKYLDIPAFRDLIYFVGYVDRGDVKKNPDGTYSFDLEKIARRFPPKDQPFLVSIQRFTRPISKNTRRFFFLENFRHDPKKYEQWLAKHPNLLAIRTLGEWGNEANMLPRRIDSFLKGEKKLTPENKAKVAEDWPNKFANRREYVEKRLKRLYDRHLEIWFNRGTEFSALEGMWCVNHLAAYWGGNNILIHETSRSLAMWQVQLMFNRGAARQFGKYWGWYAASYLTAYDSKGNWMVDAEPAAWKRSEHWRPGYGLSKNAIERVYRMAWLAGTNMFEREDVDSNFWNRQATGEERWKPAPEGQIFIDFANFVRKNPDRGVTYTPIALLVPYDQGASRNIMNAFGKFPYLKADNMYHGFIATIFPQFPRQSAQKKGREVTLRNSKYGDIFDVLTPDFPDSTALKKTLGAYHVAILTGGYEKHPAMAEALREYVQNGGTLVLNSVQLNNFDPSFTGVKLTGQTVKEDGYVLDKLELAGAKTLLSLKDGTPVFTAFDQGKGRVIVASPRWLVPDFPDATKEARTVMGETANGKRKFKYIRALLDKLIDELLPVEVTGAIQYGLNKTKDGWLVYLFNNEGITKFTDTPETFDPSKTAEVTVRLKAIEVGQAHDLCSGEDFPVDGGKFTVKVEPGRYRILKLVK
ncbi:MAG: hypothetical protein IJS14_13225 [Lentisphaeria bacterium]|nr:hypothetical protein [Lentisphaeria bacterium]